MNSMKKQGLFTCSLLGCLLGFDLASFTAAAQTTEPNEWAWMGGSNGLSQQGPPAGVFGTLGSFAAGNIPPVHSGPAIWNDGKGHIWLFSGASLSPFEFVYPNDLWEFDIATNQWAWMGGTGTVPQSSQGISGTYGTLGTPAPGNIPGGREGAATWIDKSGNLWLFGGYGFDGFGYLGYLDDWWKFDPSTGLWTWMGGSSGVSSCPITYGNLGVPNADNIPECRDYAASWTDNAGRFWMFGGTVFTSKNGTYDFGDMWELDPSTNQWAWVGGSDTVNNYGTYGTLGVPATGNIPGARSGPAYWTDSSGNFWLFGGIGYAAPVTTGALSGFENDLWMFNPTTKEWTWVNGSNVPGSTGQLGTLGTLATGNLPESRAGASGWVDSNGNIWIFGGFAETVSLDAYDSNDLWVFNPPSGQWAWMGGGSSSSLSNDYGVYGTLGTPAPGNWPGPRENSGSWTDGNGNLWLFSGVGVDSDDLWEYTPAIKGTLPTVATPTFSPAPGTYPYPQFGQIVISDATDGANHLLHDGWNNADDEFDPIQRCAPDLP
jgi:N-acetylneuraminic acid mutarotase